MMSALRLGRYSDAMVPTRCSRTTAVSHCRYGRRRLRSSRTSKTPPRGGPYEFTRTVQAITGISLTAKRRRGSEQDGRERGHAAQPEPRVHPAGGGVEVVDVQAHGRREGEGVP